MLQLATHDFVEEGTFLSHAIYLLAEQTAKYERLQKHTIIKLRTYFTDLQGAFCEGNYGRVVLLSKKMFNEAREAHDYTRYHF